MFNSRLLITFSKIIHNQTVGLFRSVSLIGVMLLFLILFQCFSGIMLAFSLITEVMLIPVSRSFEDQENLYTDDFFWAHERGVDLIFIYLVLHLLRKLYLNSHSYLQTSSWKTGAILFLLLHAVIFFGLVLCCTHLSDITLKIASNIVQTFTFKYAKLGYWLFTDKTLNTDTLLRLVYLHYLLPFLALFIAGVHMVDMHYNHRDSNEFVSTRIRFFWYDEVLFNESVLFLYNLVGFFFISLFLYKPCEPLSYEIFMWGDLGLVNEVRFLGVAPHWYFRGYMGWLILCPHHYFGIFGLVYLMGVMYYQPLIYKKYLYTAGSYSIIKQERSFIYNTLFTVFILSIAYIDSYLPYGRFFTEINGNGSSLFSYFYVFIYLSFPVYDYIRVKCVSFLKNHLTVLC